MKKLYSTIMLLAMMVAALSLTACGDDDDEIGGGNGNSSSLVGTWDIVQFVNHFESGITEYSSGNGMYWVFTVNKLTIYDSEDLMKSVDYTYSGNKLNLVGIPYYTVIELTSSKLVVKSEETFGNYITIELKKR